VQLRRLDVTNIRSFEAGRLELGPGTTLLVGDVGAGKSSLLYAVEMALFGVAEVDAAFLVRHGTAHAEVGVTLEDAEHRYTIRRRFRRGRRRGRETFEPERLTYVEDGQPASYSATEIRQRVIDLLGFPDNPNPHAHSDLWRWAIYVPQERMREILAANAEERLETVRKALGVERYRLAAGNGQALAVDLRASARHRREEAARMAHWDTELAEVHRESDRLRRERTTFAASVEQLDVRLTAVRASREERERAVARSEADRREFEGLRREDAADLAAVEEGRRRREAMAAEAASERAEAERLAPTAQAGEWLRAGQRHAEEELARRRRELDEHAEGLRGLARALEASRAASRRLSEATERARRSDEERLRGRESLSALLEQGPTREPPAPTPRSLGEIERLAIEAVEAEHRAVDAVARAHAELEAVSELIRGGVCPTCHQEVAAAEFAAHRSEAERTLREAETVRARSGEARGALDDERKARERFERAHERWVDLERLRTEARELLSRRETEATEALGEEAAARQEEERQRLRYEELRPLEAEEHRRREELGDAERRLAERVRTAEEAGRAEERLRSLGLLEERRTAEGRRLDDDLRRVADRRTARSQRLESIEQTLRRAPTELAELQAARNDEAAVDRERAEATGALVRTDTRLDDLVGRLALAEKGRAQRATLVREAEELEARAAWVDAPFRLAVLRMEKEVLAHAQVAFDRAFSRFFATLVDDPQLVARTDVSFTPEVTIAGEVTPAEALSGGERTSLALAFRLALAHVVRSLGQVRLQSLLLDEPTDGFSSEQVVRMGELLEELALPQVVVVSHENQLTGIADRTVRVMKLEGRSTLVAEGDDGASSAEGSAEPSPVAAAPTAHRPARRDSR
jgi:DNA repair protein SbcC/Rad50